MRALLLTLSLTACTPYVGLPVHPAHVDAPEHYAPNPIGIVGAEYERGPWSVFCEHSSSIPRKERGAGWNVCGVKRAIEAP